MAFASSSRVSHVLVSRSSSCMVCQRAAPSPEDAVLMPYLLEVPLPDGESVLAEITGQVDDVAPFGRGKEVIGRLSGSFADGLHHVRAFAAEVLTCMKESYEPPDR